jgi:hypothetical protein
LRTLTVNFRLNLHTVFTHIIAAARAAAHCREVHNLVKYVSSYTVILLMPYLYENGTSEAWQTLIEELGQMGYAVQDDEKIELNSSLAAEVITSVII